MLVSPDAPILKSLAFWVTIVGIGVSLLALGRFLGGGIARRLRARFVLGVPWGTVLVVAVLWAIYYVVQGGGSYGGPVVVGFRSWSYRYPLGMLFGPFSHSYQGHLVGNLVSTVAFAPIAEYAWSHYPTRRGSESFATWRSNPFVRIGLFIVGIFLVGLSTSLLIPGALIGFSGVVFAFAGLALVTMPVIAVIALAGERVVRLLWLSLNEPLVTQSGQTQFVTPFWADVAVQGHLLGFVVGVLLGLVLARSRDRWPTPSHVWGAVVAFGIAKTLYALYWYLGGSRYLLFRGVGTAMVFVLATVVAAAFAASDRAILPRVGVSRRKVATIILVGIVVIIGVIAVPYNSIAVENGIDSGDGVEIRDYTVTYAEEVPNRYVGAVRIPFVGNSLGFNESGVVVTSERRNAWEVVIPAGRLAVRGQAVVPVGGPGWRETVVVNRTGWDVVDGGSTYKIYVRHDGQRKQVYADEPAGVPAVINESFISIRPSDDGFELSVTRNRSVVGMAPVPGDGENVTIGDIKFSRRGKNLKAFYEKTHLRIAKLQLEGRQD